MGVSFSASPSHWSIGEYQYANNTQDDIAVIGTANGFGFRTDDIGNTVGTATALVYSGPTGTISTSANIGIIGSRTDVDVYSFSTTGGTALINVAGTTQFTNLDVGLTLLNGSGGTIATVNPANTLDATLALVLSAGTYYLAIDGVGNGDPFLTGYPDYSSIGQYKITGNTQLPNTPPTVTLVTPVSGTYYAAPASFELSASVGDLEGPIAKVEFYQDNVKIGEDAFYPGFGWMVNNLGAGTYTFTAKAIDQGGLSTVSDPVTVIVDGTPPTVSLIAPANNSVFIAPASFSLIADATDGQGPLKRVEFYQNNVKIGEDAFYPGFSWEVTNLAAGTYVYTAKAFDQADLSTVSAPITVVVDPCLLNEPEPPAAQFQLRNSWYDQQAGSNLSNESGALKVVHRPYGQPEIWVLETGRTINLINGLTYNVKMDFKDFSPIGVTGIDVGFATGIVQNGSGPDLVVSPVSFPSGFSSSSFTTKSVNITSGYTGSVFLAIKLKWSSQPTMQVTDYIKNLAVCVGAGTPARIALTGDDELFITEANQEMAVRPNPSEVDFLAYVKRDVSQMKICDLQGKQVFFKENIPGESQVKFGETFGMGVYVVLVHYTDGTQESRRIVKTK